MWPLELSEHTLLHAGSLQGLACTDHSVVADSILLTSYTLLVGARPLLAIL